MSDLISRQAAIDAFNCYVLVTGKTNAETISKTFDSIIGRIKALPSTQSWISVSERLPENNGRYLVTRGLNAAGNIWNRVYIVNYSDLMGLKKEKVFWIGNVGKNDFERLQDVVAWQPLPEPYKREEE